MATSEKGDLPEKSVKDLGSSKVKRGPKRIQSLKIPNRKSARTASSKTSETKKAPIKEAKTSSVEDAESRTEKEYHFVRVSQNASLEQTLKILNYNLTLSLRQAAPVSSHSIITPSGPHQYWQHYKALHTIETTYYTIIMAVYDIYIGIRIYIYIVLL